MDKDYQNTIPRISVLVITYNQEIVVRRALDSLLSQKDYIYEICINDDCSTDNTFDVLLEYQAQYPGLVKPVQNQCNLGIFENIEACWARPAGDLVYMLSGDDECGEGFFKAVIDCIFANGIDWRNDCFCVYGDYKQINKDGKEIVYHNSMIDSTHDPIKLKVRKLLSNRGSCYSINVHRKFMKVSQGRSYNAELVQEYQLQLFSEKNYYIPIVGNIYYAQLGVSTSMKKEDREDNVFGAYNRLIPFVSEWGHPLDKKDKAYINYLKAFRRHNLTQMIFYYFKSIDFSLGWKGIQFNRVLFVLRNRLLKRG